MKKAVLVLGATSSIAKSAAAALGVQGHPLFLAGRDESELARLAQDFRIRYGVEVRSGCFDADSCGGHDLFIQHVIKQMGGLEGVIVAFGYRGSQARASQDFAEAESIFLTNFIGACSLLTCCAIHLEKQGHGFVIGISSTAADRGRYSNYYYGAAKAGLTVFLQGLRNRLYHSGVHVLTVKPGRVDTESSFGRPNSFLSAKPEEVGKKIVNALQRGRNEVYIPWYWRGIMTAVKCVPEFLFKRFKF